MILATFQWVDALFVFLYVSFGLLFAIIVVKRVKARIEKKKGPKEDYCVLYSLDYNEVKGEIEFYFTAEKSKDFTLRILSPDMTEIKEVVSSICSVGGNIHRFNTTLIPNGEYYYCLRTENQKTMKKMNVNNN